MDPVASGVKCGPHGGMNSKMKSWTVSWLSLKTKAITHHHPPIPAPSRVEILQAKQQHLQQHL
jgi:hypothetical protein